MASGSPAADDHAGVDIGRTFTETPRAQTWQEFLAYIRAGRASARGEQGSAEKWAHAAMGLATRALGPPERGAKPSPQAVFEMVERVMREGDVRSGAIGADLGPDDARAVLGAWLEAVDIDTSEVGLLTILQDRDFSHAALFRRARRKHERKLAKTVGEIVAMTEQPSGTADFAAAASGLFEACVAAIPYAPAAAFLGKEKAKLKSREGEPLRVALVADGVGGMHGVTHTLDEIRERGVPGFEVEVVGTDRNVDRRLSCRRGDRHPVLRGPEGRRPVAAGCRRDARGRQLRPRPPLHAGPGRHRRRRDRADHGPPGAGQLPHRTGRIRRPARR